MAPDEYAKAWEDQPLPAPVAPGKVALPADGEYASAWTDETAGPLEKAVVAAGVAPAPAADVTKKDKQ